LSAAHRQANDSLGVASIPEAYGLLLRESAVALSERELEADRLKVQERERALAQWETAVMLREGEATRELERLESMEA
jgi:hypothetical protein